MRTSIKRSFAGAVVASSLLAPPAAAADTLARDPACTITSSFGTDGRTTSVVVAGQFVAEGPAIDTALVCHVYAGGQLAGSVNGTGAGPVAAAAGVVHRLPISGYSVCAEAWVLYPVGMRYYSTC